MGLIIVGILTILHYSLSVRIESWFTISALGFKSECPMRYLQTPGLYHWTNRILGVALILSGLLEDIEIIFTVITWILIWFLSGKNGRKQSFSNYREIMSGMHQYSEDDDEDKEDYEKYSQLTDEELQEMVDRNIKMGNF